MSITSHIGIPAQFSWLPCCPDWALDASETPKQKIEMNLKRIKDYKVDQTLIRVCQNQLRVDVCVEVLPIDDLERKGIPIEDALP